MQEIVGCERWKKIKSVKKKPGKDGFIRMPPAFRYEGR